MLLRRGILSTFARWIVFLALCVKGGSSRRVYTQREEDDPGAAVAPAFLALGVRQERALYWHTKKRTSQFCTYHKCGFTAGIFGDSTQDIQLTPKSRFILGNECAFAIAEIRAAVGCSTPGHLRQVICSDVEDFGLPPHKRFFGEWMWWGLRNHIMIPTESSEPIPYPGGVGAWFRDVFVRVSEAATAEGKRLLWKVSVYPDHAFLVETHPRSRSSDPSEDDTSEDLPETQMTIITSWASRFTLAWWMYDPENPEIRHNGVQEPPLCTVLCERKPKGATVLLGRALTRAATCCDARRTGGDPLSFDPHKRPAVRELEKARDRNGRGRALPLNTLLPFLLEAERFLLHPESAAREEDAATPISVRISNHYATAGNFDPATYKIFNPSLMTDWQTEVYREWFLYDTYEGRELRQREFHELVRLFNQPASWALFGACAFGYSAGVVPQITVSVRPVSRPPKVAITPYATARRYS